MRLPPASVLPLTLLLAAAGSIPAFAQWTETPSLLTQNRYALAPYRAPYVDPISIRQGQEALYFSTDGTAAFIRMDVCRVTQTMICENDGTTGWSRLYEGAPTYQSVRWTGVPQTLGVYDIKLRYYKIDGNGSVFQYRLAVVPSAYRAFSDAQGNSMVMWQGTTAALDSPFLVVEGIDADNVNAASDYYAIGGLQSSLLSTGRARGADVLILNFDEGGRDLRDNAEVVESAILYLNGIKTGSRRLDVAGLSMGGVVTRYALAEMERDGVPHNVGRFVSMDAPQQGAVVDRELLDWMYDPPFYASSFTPPANVTSMAGKQLLQYNPFDAASPTLHRQFYDELNGLNGSGYPRQTVENVGVSFGTPSPNPSVGRQWLEIEVDLLPNASFNIQAGDDEAGAGSLLPRDVTEIGGTANATIPGLWVLGVFPYLALSTVELSYNLASDASPTFIPYASALDIVNGQSRFSLPTLNADNARAHNVVPGNIVEPLLTRLGYPRPPLAVSMSGPTSLRVGQSGTWTNVSTGGTAPHRRLWQYFIPCAPPPPPPCNPRCTQGGEGLRVAAPPDDALLGESCDVWLDGGTANTSTKTFSYAPTGSVRVRLSISDSGDPVQSGQQTQTVRITSALTGGEGGEAAHAGAEALPSAVAAPTYETALSAVVPNPFSRSTAVQFALAEPAEVRLVVYDALGREVARLADGQLDAGWHTARFDGAALPSGVYLVRMEARGGAGAFTESRRITLVK